MFYLILHKILRHSILRKRNIYRIAKKPNEQITSLPNIVTVEKPYAIYVQRLHPDGDTK